MMKTKHKIMRMSHENANDRYYINLGFAYDVFRVTMRKKTA